MTYYLEMRELMTAIGHTPTIYDGQPTRVKGRVLPMSGAERERVEELSRERGYRRFTAERMGRV